MNIILYQDATLNLNLDVVASGLSNSSDLSLNVRKGKAKFHIAGSSISYAKSYKQLSSELLNEAKAADLVLCFTKIPYDNNYFFHSRKNLVLVSFYAWEQLTNLPMENGVVYFVASLLRYKLPIPIAHDDQTGCINDFLWDKTGIDIGMRSGMLCQTCNEYMDRYKLNPTVARLRDGINKLLHILGTASRKNENVTEQWRRIKVSRSKRRSAKFAVFLCHNTKDKAEVRRIARELENQGIRTWLDEEQLRPGMAWQVLLEKQIGSIKTVAVFVGSSGVGPWQEMEIRAFLSEFVRRNCPVIPVILSNAKTVPELPIFLRQLTWVDFRENSDVAMERLMWGITGKKPGSTSI